MPNTPEYRKAYAKGYAAGKIAAEREAPYAIRAEIRAGFDGLHDRVDRVARDVAKVATLVDYVRRDPSANQPPKLPLFYRLWSAFRALLP